MLRFCVCLTLALVSPFCAGEQTSAEQKQFWVLGSYANYPNATRERDRLSDELGVIVSLLETENLFYRVVVDSSLVSRDDLNGMDAWLLSVNPPGEAEPPAPDTVAPDPVTPEPATPEPDTPDPGTPDPDAPEAAKTEPVPEAATKITTRYRVSESDEEDPPLIIEEPPVEPLYPAFNPGETISGYCDRLPNTRLCQHPGIEKAIENDRKLMEHREATRKACEIVTDPEWRATCFSLHPPTQ